MDQADELEKARMLIRDAGGEFSDSPPVRAALAACEHRLDEPLRVALAGTLKSGKSTMLNALVGEEIAPTDATECTRVVTWFSHSPVPRVDLTHRVGEQDVAHTALPVRRQDARLVLHLGGVAAERVQRLRVGWPCALLDSYTLIDTPGTSSNSPDVSQRTLDFLTPHDGSCQADAIVYLIRAPQDTDLEPLRHIQHHHGPGRGPLGVIAVLARADETPGHGAEATSGMDSARAVTERLRTAPELAGLHRDFIAVSGLLAIRGQTLRQSEFLALATLADQPASTLRSALLSPGRFTHADLPIPGIEREHLLEAFGMIGIKTAVELIRGGARDAPALADALVRHSGLEELQHTLHTRFGGRHAQLKAHSALHTLRAILLGLAPARAQRLLRAVDHTLADTHTITELAVLAGLTALPLPQPTLAALDQTLGGQGTSPSARLGLPPDATAVTLRTAAGRRLTHWHTQLDEPLLDEPTTRAYWAAVRSCEALIATTRSTRPPG